MITMFNYDVDFQGEDLDYSTLLTVPDDSLTVNEILSRYRKGIPIGNLSHDIYYDEDGNLDEMDRTLNPDYDLADMSADIAELKEKAKDEISKRKQKKQAKPATPGSEGEQAGGSEADDSKAKPEQTE